MVKYFRVGVSQFSMGENKACILQQACPTG